MWKMTDEEFESVVQEALDSIPDRFLEALENVAIILMDEPEDYHYDTIDQPDSLGASFLDDEFLGFYDGVPLTEREDGMLWDRPDVITVFKGPHERSFDSHEEMVEEIGKTVIHEIGHYFGLDDDRLYEMGY